MGLVWDVKKKSNKTVKYSSILKTGTFSLKNWRHRRKRLAPSQVPKWKIQIKCMCQDSAV